MVISILLEFDMVKLFKSLYNVVDVENSDISDKNIWVNQHSSISNSEFYSKLSFCPP